MTKTQTKTITMTKTNTFREHLQRATLDVTFETFDQSDKGTWPDKQKDNDNCSDKDNDTDNDKDNPRDL